MANSAPTQSPSGERRITALVWDVTSLPDAAYRVELLIPISRPLRLLNKEELNEFLTYLRQKVAQAVTTVRVNEPWYAGYDKPVEKRVCLRVLSGDELVGVVYGTGRVTGLGGQEICKADN